MIDFRELRKYLEKNPPQQNGDYDKIAKKFGITAEKVRYNCRQIGLTINRNKGEPIQPVVSIEKLAQEVIKKIPPKKRYSYKAPSKKSLTPETWLQLFSDLHFGLVVRPAEVGGLAEYNPEVANQRVFYLAETVGRIIDYYPNKPKTLIIAFLGDLIDNSIMRGNQRANIAMDLTAQIMQASDLLADYIIEMSRYFETIKCFGVYGNHGRSTQGITDSPAYENFDKLIYWIVSKRIKNNKNISIEYPDSQHIIIDILGWKFWMEHGDSIRGWLGFPSYGAKREKGNIDQIMRTSREYADYLVFAHHHLADYGIDEGIIANGSFPGGDLYSIGRLRRMNIPHQLLLGVNQKHGIVWNRPIQLIDNPRNLKIIIHK